MPWCSGWVCGSRRVATSAPMANVLQGVIDSGGQVLVFVNADRLVKVTRFRAHPTYAAGGEGPLSAAVAIAETAEDLPDPAPQKRSAELTQPVVGLNVEVAAFEITQQAEKPLAPGVFAPKPYNKLDPPHLTKTPAKIISTRSIAGAPRDLPLLRIDMPSRPGCDGSPVLDGTGAVIGTLLHVTSDDAFYVVLCDHLADFKD